MKKGVLTTYYIDEIPYCAYVLGSDMNVIAAKIKQRGLGEKVESSLMEITPIKDYSSMNDEDLFNNLPEILHALCYISFIALKSQSVTIEEVLGDRGVIHELTHILSDVEGRNKKSLVRARDLIKNIQSKATGLY